MVMLKSSNWGNGSSLGSRVLFLRPVVGPLQKCLHSWPYFDDICQWQVSEEKLAVFWRFPPGASKLPFFCELCILNHTKIDWNIHHSDDKK